jgi:hypothetical protein
LLQDKPCIVTVIIFVIIPLLTGNVLFDVQGVQAERAGGGPTIFQTNSPNPQITTSGVHMPYHWSPTTAKTFSGVPMPSGYGIANTANTNNKGVSSTTTTTNTYQANQANTANTNNKGVSSTHKNTQHS